MLQIDVEGRDCVITFESRKLKATEKKYPVYDIELLAMKYALVKFRVHLLGSKPFVVYEPCIFAHGNSVSPPVAENDSLASLFAK